MEQVSKGPAEPCRAVPSCSQPFPAVPSRDRAGWDGTSWVGLGWVWSPSVPPPAAKRMGQPPAPLVFKFFFA